MNRNRCFAGWALGIAALLAGVRSPAATLTIGSASGAPGEKLTVPVTLGGPDTISQLMFTVALGQSAPAGMPPLAADPVPAGPAGEIVDLNVDGMGSATGLAQAAAGALSPGAVMTLGLTIPASAPAGTLYTLAVTYAAALDAKGGPVRLAVQPGFVKVGGTPAAAPVLTALDVEPNMVSVPVGASQDFVANGLDMNKSPFPVAVRWAVDRPELADIDGSGRLTALEPGTVQVIATFGNVTGDATVTIPAPVNAAPADTVAAGSASAAPGAQVDVPITLQGIVPLGSLALTIDWADGAGLLSLVGVKVPDGLGSQADTSATGRVKLAIAAGDLAIMPGTIATLTFAVAANAPAASVAVTPAVISAQDVTGLLFTLPGVPGTLTITGARARPAGITIADVSAAAGDPVTIVVSVDGTAKNVGASTLLIGTGSALEIAGPNAVALGSIYDPKATAQTVSLQTPGQVQVTAKSTTGASGPGSLVSIVATVPPGTAPGAYPLSIVAASLTDLDGRPIPSAAAGATLTVTAPPLGQIIVQNVTGSPGHTVAVEIDADAGVANIAGAKLVLQFGSIGTVDPRSVVAGNLISGSGAAVVANTQVPGQVTIGLAGSDVHSGPGALVTVPIALDPMLKAGNYPLTLIEATVSDASGRDRPVKSIGGRLSVSAHVCGDATGDGKVTIADATLALRMAVGLVQPTPDQLAALDTNGNSKVDISDVVLLLRYVIGLRTDLPCGSAVPAGRG